MARQSKKTNPSIEQMKKEWIKEQHDKAVKVHHSNLNRIRTIENEITQSIRKLSNLNESINLLESTRDNFQWEDYSTDQQKLVAKFMHVPSEDGWEDCGVALGETYENGISCIRDCQKDLCRTVTELQKDIEENSFDKSWETCQRESDEKMLGKKFDRLLKKGEINIKAKLPFIAEIEDQEENS